MDILIASDLHLGFEEKHPERRNDSFNTLKEILEIATDKKVDFILLGGDLFHINRPSKHTLHTTLDLLQHYCLGDRRCKVEVVSDNALNFGKRLASETIISANYENPNINITMPVFSIHGNHDNPTGISNFSAVDLLSVTGLLNHFGKQNGKEIKISPVLLKKGTSKLALYGLGFVRDYQLHKLFEDKKVVFEELPDQQDWFNVFVLHQNRAQYNEKAYVEERFIPDFIDLVIWGHEHECRITPEQSKVKKFKIMQPGSSVATQIRETEAKPKYVAVLQLNDGKNYETEKILLESVRQMYIEKVVLSDEVEKQPSAKDTEQKVKNYCTELVNSLLKRATEDRILRQVIFEKTNNKREERQRWWEQMNQNQRLRQSLLEKVREDQFPRQDLLEKANEDQVQPEKPIIQLKIDYRGGFDIFNRHQFGDKFRDRLANPDSVVLFQKKKTSADQDKGGASSESGKDFELTSMSDLIRNYFEEQEKNMQLLQINDMYAAVDLFVNQQESQQAIFKAIEDQKTEVVKKLNKMQNLELNRSEIVKEICRINGVPHIDMTDQPISQPNSSTKRNQKLPNKLQWPFGGPSVSTSTPSTLSSVIPSTSQAKFFSRIGHQWRNTPRPFSPVMPSTSQTEIFSRMGRQWGKVRKSTSSLPSSIYTAESSSSSDSKKHFGDFNIHSDNSPIVISSDDEESRDNDDEIKDLQEPPIKRRRD